MTNYRKICLNRESYQQVKRELTPKELKRREEMNPKNYQIKSLKTDMVKIGCLLK